MRIKKPNEIEQMEKNINQIKTKVYDKCSFEISDFKTKSEGKEYNACQYKLNRMNVLCRNAKVTPVN